VTARMLAEGPVTIDLDATDAEVYGRKNRGVATIRGSGCAARTWPPGPRPCWPLTWARAPTTRGRVHRACCAARWQACQRRGGLGGGRARPRRIARQSGHQRHHRIGDVLAPYSRSPFTKQVSFGRMSGGTGQPSVWIAD
jgi:hypothetical protein